MKSSEIRESFINFFKERDHTYVHSSPSVAVGDPTLMFTNAGMNQFKDIFLGVEQRSYTRAVNSQKCIRVSGKHNDLDEVGRDGTHHTFFEMLGNWSFGDYYKKEIIPWAWELLTDVWNMPKDKLYASIFEDDDEAGELWKTLTDINPEHIIKFDARENFWEMGDTGPCGPCSEIHFDRGEQYSCGSSCTVNCDCGRFVEFWNLVFIQYNRKKDGTLEPLAKTHVDTGMGLERISALLNGLAENYDTDLFQPLFDEITAITGIAQNDENRTQFRVIADHVRMLTMSVCDGAVPANEGRGYVVRRVLRRGVRFANLLKEGAPILSKLSSKVVEIMGGFFSELTENPDYITEVIRSEEEQFQRTLKQGNDLFNKITADHKPGDQVDGNDIFTLYDTYGFPSDLVALMAEEKGLSVDMDGFDAAMQAQKERSRAGAKAQGVLDADLELPASTFIGYDSLIADSNVVASGPAYIAVESTPFYPDGGGQKGDCGLITAKGLEFQVNDTRREKGVIVHLGTYTNGNPPEKGTEVKLTVNADMRSARQANHTATHLLQNVLRETLGSQVKQQGSMVDSDRFTFDFTFPRKITAEEIEAIENDVNALIRKDLPVQWYETSLEEARESGVIALFDEKYGEKVRVIDIGDGLSRELCGGTHVTHTGAITWFAILSEEAISAGNRRIEGCTGDAVVKRRDQRRGIIDDLCGLCDVSGMKVTVDGLGGNDVIESLHASAHVLRRLIELTDSQESMLIKKVGNVIEENQTLRKQTKSEDALPSGPLYDVIANLIKTNKELQKKVEQQNKGAAGELAANALDSAVEVDGIQVIALYLGDTDPKQLNAVISSLQEKNAEGLCLCAGASKGKASLLCAAGPAAIEAGFKAGDIIRAIGKAAGGGGGGGEGFARGGGGDPAKTEEALNNIAEVLKG